MEVNPLSIILVKSDSKGDRLLFRYPHAEEGRAAASERRRSGRHNPYAVNISEDLLQSPLPQTSNVFKGHLAGFTDEVLSTLFAVKAELCNRKFELKVNDVRFVGHPTLLPYRSSKDDTVASMILINIVFALQASASHSIVKCYYDLSKRLGKALRHEEKRCSYLSEQMKIMMCTADETSALEGEGAGGDGEREEESVRGGAGGGAPRVDTSPLHLILQRSSLARSLATVFKELSTTGLVQVRINKWVLVSFCLPHKAHQTHNTALLIEPETIDKCLSKLKPYHGMLLMVDPNELLQSMPLDGSAALLRLIKLYSPLKSLQSIALDADLQMAQVFQLTGHLVYWAKATIIYPLCASNVYVVASGANVRGHSALTHAFTKEFPNLCLLQVLAMFSLPAPLWYHARCGAAGGGADGARLARLTAWLLRRRLLLQLHTYVQFNMSHWGYVEGGKEYYCEKHSACGRTMSDSFSSLGQLQPNNPEPIEARASAGSHYRETHDGLYPTENHLNQTDFSHTKPIVIESDPDCRYDASELDSANHSFDDGVDTVDGVMRKSRVNGHAEESDKINKDKLETEKRLNGTSVDSGISANLNGERGSGGEEGQSRLEKKLSGASLSSEASRGSDGGRLDARSDHERSPRRRADPPPRPAPAPAAEPAGNNGVSLHLKIQNEMSLQPPTVVWTATLGCDATDAAPGKPPPAAGDLSEEALLADFTEEEKDAIFRIPAAHNPEDLALLVQLHKKGYLRGEHHLEEIMFYENVTRSQVLMLIDKFRDVLITFETEDPAIAMLYSYH